MSGQTLEVFKDPVTDPGKKSKAGDLTLVRDENANGRLRTVKIQDITAGQVRYDYNCFIWSSMYFSY